MKVPEPKTAKNRVHVDVQAGGARGEPQEIRWARVLEAVQRLTGAGATVICQDLQDGSRITSSWPTRRGPLAWSC